MRSMRVGDHVAKGTVSSAERCDLVEWKLEIVRELFQVYMSILWKKVVFNKLNSKLDWNDNLASIFEAKMTLNSPSSSVPYYCVCRRS